MTEPLSAGITAKTIYVTMGLLLAGIANAFQEVKKSGYKGLWMFLGSVLAAVVAGEIMYTFLNVYKPEYALPISFAASYIGPNSIKVLWEVFKKAIAK